MVSNEPRSAVDNKPTTVKASLEAVQATVSKLEESLEHVGRQSKDLSSSAPSRESVKKQIGAMRQGMHSHDAKQKKQMEKLKNRMQDGFREKVTTFMQPKIKELIKGEVAEQVEREVNSMIAEYIPIPLTQQVAESKKKVEQMQCLLHNSESRRRNSCISPEDASDPLAPVFKEDGSQSERFPANLGELWSYDLEKTKKLLGDYGLEESPILEVNLNRFLNHIGVPYEHILISMDKGK